MRGAGEPVRVSALEGARWSPYPSEERSARPPAARALAMLYVGEIGAVAGKEACRSVLDRRFEKE